MRFPATSGWGPLVLLVGGPSPNLAEGPGGGSPPVLAGVRWFWWWVVPHESWVRALGAVPRHAWLGSARCGGGCGASVCSACACWCVCVCVCLWCVRYVLACLPPAPFSWVRRVACLWRLCVLDGP